MADRISFTNNRKEGKKRSPQSKDANGEFCQLRTIPENQRESSFGSRASQVYTERDTMFSSHAETSACDVSSDEPEMPSVQEQSAFTTTTTQLKNRDLKKLSKSETCDTLASLGGRKTEMYSTTGDRYRDQITTTFLAARMPSEQQQHDNTDREGSQCSLEPGRVPAADHHDAAVSGGSSSTVNAVEKAPHKSTSSSLSKDIKGFFSKERKFKKSVSSSQSSSSHVASSSGHSTAHNISFPIYRGIDKARANLMTWFSPTYSDRTRKRGGQQQQSVIDVSSCPIGVGNANNVMVPQLVSSENSRYRSLSVDSQEDESTTRKATKSTSSFDDDDHHHHILLGSLTISDPTSPPRDDRSSPFNHTYFRSDGHALLPQEDSSGGLPMSGKQSVEHDESSVRNSSLSSSLPGNASEKHHPYASFEEFLLSQDLELIKAFCSCLQATDMSRICTSLTHILEYKKQTVSTIKALIYYESSLQKTSTTLFRSNSFTTNMMTAYTKLVGMPFLKTTIGMVMLNGFELIDSGQCTFEIDPGLLHPDEDLDRNITDLKQIVRDFLNNIINSRAVIPRSFMEICTALRDATSVRFPDARYFVIGGFIFLRLICPAMVLPESYHIIDASISNAQRRMLVLASKILQTLANQRTFGEKESYMMAMNPIISEYQEMLQYFFSVLSKPPSPDAPENIPTIIFTSADYERELKCILREIEAIKHRLLDAPQIKSCPEALGALQSLNSIPLLDKKAIHS